MNIFSLNTANQYFGCIGLEIHPNTKFEKIGNIFKVTANNIDLSYNFIDISAVFLSNYTSKPAIGIYLEGPPKERFLIFCKNNQKIITSFYMFKKEFNKRIR